MSKIKTILTYIGGLLLLGLFIFGSSSVSQALPSNLVLLADHEYKTYSSPECLNPNIDYETDDFEIVTYEFANDTLNYETDSACTYESLWPERNTLWNFVGTKFGFIKPLDWKWNEDGSWDEDVFK